MSENKDDIKNLYDSYDKCKTCTQLNTVSCLSCANFTTFSASIEKILDNWYDEYRKKNDINFSQIQNNYQFDTVFEQKDDDIDANVTLDDDVVDITEVTDVE